MELFTWEVLGSLAGATVATVLIVNAVKAATGWSPRWLALAVALVIQLALWTVITDRSWPALLLAIVNAFVVYAAATGGNQIVGALRAPQATSRAAAEQPAGFWSPWW